MSITLIATAPHVTQPQRAPASLALACTKFGGHAHLQLSIDVNDGPGELYTMLSGDTHVINMH